MRKPELTREAQEQLRAFSKQLGVLCREYGVTLSVARLSDEIGIAFIDHDDRHGWPFDAFIGGVDEDGDTFYDRGGKVNYGILIETFDGWDGGS